MDLYHIWCNLAPGSNDLEFCGMLRRYLEHLCEQGLLESFRITRKKLGLAPRELGEFHLMVETEDLAQLDRAFRQVARRIDPIESFHQAVNSRARDVRFALYRDFPDEVRESGNEKF